MSEGIDSARIEREQFEAVILKQIKDCVPTEYFKKELQKPTRCLATSVMQTVSSLNGNQKTTKKSDQWIWEKAGFVSQDIVDGDEVKLSDFLRRLFEEIPQLASLHNVTSPEQVPSEFLYGPNYSTELHRFMDTKAADNRWWPSSGKWRVRRPVHAIVLMNVLASFEVQTNRELAERWVGEFAPNDDLAQHLCRFPGVSATVGLAQLRRLCGDETAIKVDRRLLLVIPELLGLPTSIEDTHSWITSLAANHSTEQGPTTAAQMDHALFRWMAPEERKKRSGL